MDILKQHVIDPEICIRCNTCEATCPIGAVTHDANNYVVDPAICNHCMACVPPCPTGSIDNWRLVDKENPYSLEDQFSWDSLPEEKEEINQGQQSDPESPKNEHDQSLLANGLEVQAEGSGNSALHAPLSALHPLTNLYGIAPNPPFIEGAIVGNYRLTQSNGLNDTHHIVIDFGNQLFQVAEGQSIGIIPAGKNAQGKPHRIRQYSIASPRNGERAGYNNLSLTVKRVVEDYEGHAVKGIASNYLCDRQIGDKVQVTGPYGKTFLMPNQPNSHIIMICTGTGSAPMRAMTEWRRRQRKNPDFANAKLKLFFGARQESELPYFGPLLKLPKDFIELHFAFSRMEGQPKRYVQDLMLEDQAALAPLLSDENAYFYICGIKAMEAGVLNALETIADKSGLNWSKLHGEMKAQARIHFETY